MKSLFIAFFVVLFVSCNSDDDGLPEIKDYTAINEQEIIDYLNEQGLDNATRTSSGLYYIIDEVGEGAQITETSDVAMRFKSLLVNGDILDDLTDTDFAFNLTNSIVGLAEGLQYLREGGSGKFFIPSHLAFGNQNLQDIPSGSVIIFEIDVIDYDAENELEIIKYIEENDLNAVKSDSGSGLYYVIEEQGTGEEPTAASDVTVAYKGYYSDGEVFDESDDDGRSFNLSQVIPGWTEGMQFFKEGGKGKILIPSSIGYGIYGRQTIPGGAVLIFDVTLKSVN